MNPTQELFQQGQSVWLDFLSRGLLAKGELERMVHDVGVRGLTSNPTIFAKALAEGSDYDEGLRSFLETNPKADAKALYENFAVADIQAAANLLRPIYDQSGCVDGMVSLEVSPDLAYDTRGTIQEARRLWKAIDRPNAMIKIPATPEGIAALETCIGEGININATLIFSVDKYVQVAEAYIRGLEKSTLPSQITSVASFFVSRIDGAVDKQLETLETEQAKKLRGQIGIANSKVAYLRFEEIFGSEAFDRQRSRGAHVQRVLWASTSTKNPNYRDTLYVEELIGPETINTVPPDTLKAFADHGQVRSSLKEDSQQAAARMAQLKAVGVDFAAITDKLLQNGVASFAESFQKILDQLEKKRTQLLGTRAHR